MIEHGFMKTILCILGVSILCVETHSVAQSNSSPKPGIHESGSPKDSDPKLPSVTEARTRAKILHETLHGVLQVVHRDFFRKNEATKIPSRSLEDAFEVLEEKHDIRIRWISVDLPPMNLDNEPETEFEKQAVKMLKAGKKEHESVSKGRYNHAAPIRLSATCLSCHAPRRSNNDDRKAGLVLSMPVRQ